MSELIYPKDTKPGEYSELCVMKSAAGYYVGTYYMEPPSEHYPASSPFLVPGSRDSDYFATFEEAQAYLDWTNGEGHINSVLSPKEA